MTVETTRRPAMPWRRVLLFALLISSAIGAVLSGLEFLLVGLSVAGARLTVPPGIPGPRSVRLPAWDPLTISGYVAMALGVVIAAGLILVVRRMRRGDRRRLRWRILITIPVLFVTGQAIGIPIFFGSWFLGQAIATTVQGSQNRVVLQNDTSATVTVRYCPKQDCAGAPSVRLGPGTSHDYPAPKNDPTPDELVITGLGSSPRCELVSALGPDEVGPIPMSVSQADTQTC